MIRIKKRRPFSDPMESGSLTDLAFLLIIYFIVIAGFNVNKGYLLNLPEENNPRVVQTEELMRVYLDGEGRILKGDLVMSTEELAEAVRAQREAWPETTLLLTVHSDCPYQYMVDVIHQIRKLKVENFSFKMEEPVL